MGNLSVRACRKAKNPDVLADKHTRQGVQDDAPEKSEDCHRREKAPTLHALDTGNCIYRFSREKSTT
jgi:hypothetical protein